jgi:uncharacterized protein (TIGR01244 family)
MELRQITPDYIVSPQISVEDVPAIAAAGIKTVICNRPDTEIGAEHHAARIEEAVRAAGMEFVLNPFDNRTMTADNMNRQREVIEGMEKPVLAYCRTGTRSTVVWALGQAGSMSVHDIIQSAENAGYQLAGMQSQLLAMARQHG